MRSGALLVHTGLPKVAGPFAFVQNADDILGAGHNVLSQASHINATLLAFMDLQLGVCVAGEQIMHLLVVQLQSKTANGGKRLYLAATCSMGHLKFAGLQVEQMAVFQKHASCEQLQDSSASLHDVDELSEELSRDAERYLAVQTPCPCGCSFCLCDKGGALDILSLALCK